MVQTEKEYRERTKGRGQKPLPTPVSKPATKTVEYLLATNERINGTYIVNGESLELKDGSLRTTDHKTKDALIRRGFHLMVEKVIEDNK